MKIKWTKLPGVPGRPRQGSELAGCKLFIAKRPEPHGDKPYSWMVVRSDGRAVQGNVRTARAAKAAAVARSRGLCPRASSEAADDTESKTAAQLDREIAEALSRPISTEAMAARTRAKLDPAAYPDDWSLEEDV